MVGAVSGQCGEEIAEHIRTLGERILLHMGCELRKRMYLCFLNSTIYCCNVPSTMAQNIIV